MLRRHIAHNVVGYIAVFIALGGTSYAAITITSKNVRDNSLTGRDIRNGSLTGDDIGRGSVPLDRLSGSLATGSPGSPGSPGPQGPEGPQGERGLPGANGATNVTVRRATGTHSVSCSPGPPNNTVVCNTTGTTITARCGAGERATGGGVGEARGTSAAGANFFARKAAYGEDQPDPVTGTPTGWSVQIEFGSRDAPPAGSYVVTSPPVYVVCAAP